MHEDLGPLKPYHLAGLLTEEVLTAFPLLLWCNPGQILLVRCIKPLITTSRAVFWPVSLTLNSNTISPTQALTSMLCVLSAPVSSQTILLPLPRVISNPVSSQIWVSRYHKNICSATANACFGGCARLCRSIAYIKPGQKISAEKKSHLVSTSLTSTSSNRSPQRSLS